MQQSKTDPWIGQPVVNDVEREKLSNMNPPKRLTAISAMMFNSALNAVQEFPPRCHQKSLLSASSPYPVGESASIPLAIEPAAEFEVAH